MTVNDLPEPPRLLSQQLLYLLIAEVRREKQPDTPFLDCFTCHRAVTSLQDRSAWPAGQEDRLLTVQPCGHRFTYSATTADLMRARAKAAAATEAARPEGWEDLRAAAMDTVTSVLEGAGCWLPQAVRRTLADAVLNVAASQLHPTQSAKESA